MISDLEATIQLSKFILLITTVDKAVMIFFDFIWTGSENSPTIRSVYHMKTVETETFVTWIWTYFGVTAAIDPIMKVFRSYYNYYVMDGSSQSFERLLPTE